MISMYPLILLYILYCTLHSKTSRLTDLTSDEKIWEREHLHVSAELKVKFYSLSQLSSNQLRLELHPKYIFEDIPSIFPNPQTFNNNGNACEDL